MRWSIAQWGLLVIALQDVAKAVMVLLSGPSFAIGPTETTQLFGMDYNGWHAIAGLLLFAPGILFATRNSWAVAYLLAAATAGAIPGIWALFTPQVMWLLYMPHNIMSGVLHLVVAAVMVTIAVIQIRIDGGLARSLEGIPALAGRLRA